MNQLLQTIQLDTNTVLIPIIFIVASVLIGFFFEKIIVPIVKKFTLKTRWKVDEILVESVKGMVLLWFLCAGTYAAIVRLPLDPDLFMMLKQILLIIVITTFTVVTSRIASGFIHLYASKIRNIFASTSIFSNITKVIIFIVGVLIALQTLGISITPILTALGVGGLAVALALQDSLSNLFAGLHIIASGQVKPGDFVKISSGENGYVQDITWRNTTIRSISNDMVIIPNSKMADSIITNYSQANEELSVRVAVMVSYDNDLDLVEKNTIEVAEDVLKSTPGAVKGFKPFIRYEDLGTTQIKFTVIMRGKEYIDRYLLTHEFIKKLLKRYNEVGIYMIPGPVVPHPAK